MQIDTVDTWTDFETIGTHSSWLLFCLQSSCISLQLLWLFGISFSISVIVLCCSCFATHFVSHIRIYIVLCSLCGCLRLSVLVLHLFKIVFLLLFCVTMQLFCMSAQLVDQLELLQTETLAEGPLDLLGLDGWMDRKIDQIFFLLSLSSYFVSMFQCHHSFWTLNIYSMLFSCTSYSISLQSC